MKHSERLAVQMQNEISFLAYGIAFEQISFECISISVELTEKQSVSNGS